MLSVYNLVNIGVMKQKKKRYIELIFANALKKLTTFIGMSKLMYQNKS